MKRFRYPDQSLNHLVQVLETQLDSSIQIIVKGGKRPQVILRQLRRCLGIARRLQKIYPQRDFSLLRCTNADELPWFKVARIPRSYARTDWNKYKQEKREAEVTPPLSI